MSINLSIKNKEVNDQTILELQGEIDVYTYPSLNDALLNLISSGITKIIINIENIAYIDSTGLGVLANSANKIQDKDGELRIICTNPQLIKVFDVSGLTSKNLKIYKNEQLAIS